MIERAGGTDVFPEFKNRRAARERMVLPEQVLAADPEIIVASWCGKPVDRAKMSARPGWQKISAIQNDRIHELPAADILQPGFRLVYGFERLKQLIGNQG